MKSVYAWMGCLIASISIAGICCTCGAQETTPAALSRHYHIGDVLRYEMKGSNQGWEYRILATDVVKQDATGNFYEEISWSNLQSNAPMTLSPASLAMHQTLSLDGSGKYMSVPDLSRVQPALIGPITDLLTIYSDLMLAFRHQLGEAHPHASVEHAAPNSWADGQRVTLGQDSINFDLGFVGEDREHGTTTFLVRHVVPQQPQIALPAAWMRTPVSDTPNNWVQVTKTETGYEAEVGQETFDVRIVVDSRDGKILSASIDNPLTAISRRCREASLEQCDVAVPMTVHRSISLRLLP